MLEALDTYRTAKANATVMSPKKRKIIYYRQYQLKQGYFLWYLIWRESGIDMPETERDKTAKLGTLSV